MATFKLLPRLSSLSIHFLFMLLIFTIARPAIAAEPLRVGYSDWPGWVAWEIAIKKQWFEKAGVDIEFIWMDYVESLDAYADGQLDGVTITNGDALAIGATGAPSKMILVNDYSNGNDIVVSGPGIETVAELKEKKVGVEAGFVGHLLLLNALMKEGMSQDNIEIVNVPTDAAPELLAERKVSAIVAWQPHSGRALQEIRGSKAVYSSRNEPGLIYDVLAVTPESLNRRRDDWQKVVKIWYDVVDYINNPETQNDAIKIMAERANIPEKKYKDLLAGTKLLDLAEVKQVFPRINGFRTLYGSSKISDSFFLANQVYDQLQDVDSYIDLSLMQALTK